MNSRDFCYWLQGYFELSNQDDLTASQIDTIKKHLQLVFAHEIDPLFGAEEHQKKLNEIHNNSTNTTMRC